VGQQRDQHLVRVIAASTSSPDGGMPSKALVGRDHG
jgi:hypothetical protein